MSRFVIGSRAELIAKLRKMDKTPERDEEIRSTMEDLFLDALFITAQFPGGQIPEAEKCCYAYDVRQCAGLNRATYSEESFWCGIARVKSGRSKVTRLMHAAALGDPARVEWLLKRGAPKDDTNLRGMTALHWSSLSGNIKTTRTLIDAGFDVNKSMNNGMTPLFLASGEGHTDVVRLLLSSGSNVNIASTRGSPLYMAARNDRGDVLRLLLKAGANIEAARPDVNETPIFAATAKGNFKIMRNLIAAGANVNATCTDGITPIHVAVYNDEYKIVKQLIYAGANVNTLTNTGLCPLQCLRLYGLSSAAIEAFLKKHGAVKPE